MVRSDSGQGARLGVRENARGFGREAGIEIWCGYVGILHVLTFSRISKSTPIPGSGVRISLKRIQPSVPGVKVVMEVGMQWTMGT